MTKLLSSPEVLAGIGALAGAAAVGIKKLFSRRPPKAKPEYITRAEFHQGMDSLRDRIAAGYMAVTEKIDSSHREIERRLDQLDTAVARLDERTRLSL
jgi:hypothetical protein